MSIKLPTRPNLEHLRSQAKALLSSLRAAEADAITSFKKFLPDAPRPSLADAQTVVARQYGFASWPRLVKHVEALRSLEGTWLFTAMEIEGTTMPAHNLGGAGIVIDGDRFCVNSVEAKYVGVYSIDVGQVPHTIDMNFVEGPETGRSSFGIFEHSGDHWRICLGLTGVARPVDFVSTPGSHHVVETLRRGAATNQSLEASDAIVSADSEGWEMMSPELERIQGDWTPISIKMNGKELPAEHVAEGVRTTNGNETSLKFGPQLWMQALTRIDSAHDPIHIDYLHTSGQGKGMVQRGILMWKGESFCVCMGKPAGPRPTEFESPEGDGFTLSWWERHS